MHLLVSSARSLFCFSCKNIVHLYLSGLLQAYLLGRLGLVASTRRKRAASLPPNPDGITAKVVPLMSYIHDSVPCICKLCIPLSFGFSFHCYRSLAFWRKSACIIIFLVS